MEYYHGTVIKTDLFLQYQLSLFFNNFKFAELFLYKVRLLNIFYTSSEEIF